jgi:hypothetical protein
MADNFIHDQLHRQGIQHILAQLNLCLEQREVGEAALVIGGEWRGARRQMIVGHMAHSF